MSPRRLLAALSGPAILVLALAFVYHPAPQPQPVGLVSAVVFDTHEYPANGSPVRLTWTNNTGRRITIRKSYLWIGMYRGGIADSDAQVIRVSDGSIVAKLQWDHYAEPVAPVFKDDYFDPGMILEAGDQLALSCFSRSLTEPQTVAAVQFIMWWQ